jgi:hypothetical protein
MDKQRLAEIEVALLGLRRELRESTQDPGEAWDGLPVPTWTERERSVSQADARMLEAGWWVRRIGEM